MDNGNENINSNTMQNVYINDQPSLQTTQLTLLVATTSITDEANAADNLTELTDENNTKEENGDNVTVKEDDRMQQPTTNDANISAEVVNLQDDDMTTLEEMFIKEGDAGNTGDKSNVDDIEHRGAISHVQLVETGAGVLSDATTEFEVTTKLSIASISDCEKNVITGVEVVQTQIGDMNDETNEVTTGGNADKSVKPDVQVIQTQIENINDETTEVTTQNPATTVDDGDTSGEISVQVVHTKPGVLNSGANKLVMQYPDASITEGVKTDINEELETGSDYSELPSAPGDLIEIESSSNSISLAWNAPKQGSNNVDYYEIKYKICNKRGVKWIPVVTETSRRTVTVTDLKCGTDYEFRIRAVNEDSDEGPYGTTAKFSTRLSLAKSVQIGATKIKDGNPSIYKLPLYQLKNSINMRARTRKCIFGNKKGVCAEKTIMLVGATGSGKSTLIDGMINYITDVSWDDDFRFSLVDLTDDEKKKHKNQAESQTEWITCYTIHKMDGSKINFDLNIIDTPGFGDTRGIIRDKAIVDQIREFFTTPGDQGVAFLDAICFVTQAPMARLTPPQRYIFDSILSIFGQDVANNIFVLITFADGNEPPVRDALKAANVPFQKSFKFNNSALFASTGKAEEAKFGNLFWKMGQESFLIFFNELDKVDPKSLQLTTEVLQLRKNLEVTIQGLQPQITEGINKLNTIRQEQDVLKRHKTDIAANRNFTYEVDEIHMRKIDLEPGTYVTNCLTCNRTCHFPCGIPDDHGKHGCWAMSNGDCRICPKRCNWIIHKNNSFRFETYNVKMKKTYDELKKKYEIAQQEEKKQRSVLGKVRTAFSALGRNVMTMVHDVRGYINKLNEIALRPNPLSDIDYIDLLIESEKNEKKHGWDQRLKLFYKMREEAELVSKTSKANYKPWGTDADIINEIDD